MTQASPQTIYLKDYQPPAFLVERIDLRFELGEEGTLVASKIVFQRNPASRSAAADLRLDGEGLENLGLWLDGRALGEGDFCIDDDGLWLYGVPDRFELKSRVRIHPESNTALEGLYQSGGIFCTQCEAEGFRKITWYLDRPDVMARFTTAIVADPERYPVMLSNGNPVSDETLGDGRREVVWEDPHPKPSYLFALVAGALSVREDRFVTASEREVALRIYVEEENIDKCEHAMESLKKAMAWDEVRYGREYDLDIYMIVAVNDFNMGAMENKGLNIFNSKFVLARSDTATDRDFQGIEGVIAHEYFHNWTGNRITCRDWFQLSLKEGLTVFRDQQFSAEMGSAGVKRIEGVRLLRQHQFAEDSGPMAHPIRPDAYIEINNFYTVTVYEKGAEVIRMLFTLLGAEGFRRGTDLYFERHDGEAVTTEDFVACMADASGRDLSQFRHWYDQAGTPRLKISEQWDEAQKSYRLRVEQNCPPTPGQPRKPAFHIPLVIALLDPSGEELPPILEGEQQERRAGSRVLEITEPVTEFRFTGLDQRPVPSLLRGFSAPVNLEYAYGDDDLMFLMAHDSDPFSRWDAAQILWQRVLLARLEEPRYALPEGLLQAFARVLEDKRSDQALLAEVLELPSEAWLGDLMDEVDVDGIHQARQWLMAELGGRLRGALLRAYQRNTDRGPYDVSSSSIARRSLKNRCLAYLMASPDEEIERTCIAQYQAGSNMTDVMAALQLIAHGDHPRRGELLEDFYQRWQNDPLVLDKWFTVQALSQRTDTLEVVGGLRQHPAFSIRNPNRVRSLIGAFSTANPVRFHRKDGEGYRFLVDNILELDPLNPQVAARLLRALTRWRRYDGHRQKLMREELARILAAESISRDLFEVASKSVGGG